MCASYRLMVISSEDRLLGFLSFMWKSVIYHPLCTIALASYRLASFRFIFFRFTCVHNELKIKCDIFAPFHLHAHDKYLKAFKLSAGFIVTAVDWSMFVIVFGVNMNWILIRFQLNSWRFSERMPREGKCIQEDASVNC